MKLFDNELLTSLIAEKFGSVELYAIEKGKTKQNVYEKIRVQSQRFYNELVQDGVLTKEMVKEATLKQKGFTVKGNVTGTVGTVQGDQAFNDSDCRKELARLQDLIEAKDKQIRIYEKLLEKADLI